MVHSQRCTSGTPRSRSTSELLHPLTQQVLGTRAAPETLSRNGCFPPPPETRELEEGGGRGALGTDGGQQTCTIKHRAPPPAGKSGFFFWDVPEQPVCPAPLKAAPLPSPLEIPQQLHSAGGGGGERAAPTHEGADALPRPAWMPAARIETAQSR